MAENNHSDHISNGQEIKNDLITNGIPSYTIRLMKEDDVQECLSIFASYHLPEMKYGLETYRKIEPEGCYVMVDNDDGSILSFCTASMYDPRVAYISFYGTRPGLQGKGLGIKVWKKVMDFIGPDRNIGLCSSPSQAELYKKKAGFIYEGPDKMIHYESTKSSVAEITPTEEENSLVKILPVTDDLMDDIIKYDEKIIGFNRSQYLKLGFKEPGTSAIVAVDPSDRHRILGIAAMKPTNYDDRPVLAPLYADSYTIGKVLLYNTMTKNPLSVEKGYMTYMLDSNEDAKVLADKTGLIAEFSCPRLFTQKAVEGVDTKKVLSLMSPAFGPY